jgi:hypothetical protein
LLGQPMNRLIPARFHRVLERMLEVNPPISNESPGPSPKGTRVSLFADPDSVPYIESSQTPVRVMLKPFSADDLYHAVRDAITRATDLAAIAEMEIVRAHEGLSKLAQALEASRTIRAQTIDLVVAARELLRANVAHN